MKIVEKYDKFRASSCNWTWVGLGFFAIINA